MSLTFYNIRYTFSIFPLLILEGYHAWICTFGCLARYRQYSTWNPYPRNQTLPLLQTRLRIALIIDQQSLDDIMKLPEAESDVYYKEKLVSCCKALTRWGIDRRQACPWFYVAPALLTSLWFSAMHEELAYKLTCISDNPLTFEMTIPLHRTIRQN